MQSSMDILDISSDPTAEAGVPGVIGPLFGRGCDCESKDLAADGGSRSV